MESPPLPPSLTLATRKRPSSSSAAATEKEEEKAADGEYEKKRKRAVAAARGSGEDFREVIGTLIRIMHLNIMTVSAQSISEPFNDNRLPPPPPSPPPSSLSSFTTLLPIDDTLQRMREIALSDAIPWKTFWSDVYVGMCATVHYFNVPDETHSNQQHLYLFSPTRLESITDRFATEYNLSAATRQHLFRIYAASSPPSFESRILNGATARDHNDKVYEMMWCQMSDVASTCVDIVCEALEIHAKRTSARASEYDELCECIRLAYETAMLRGHVLLAAPLSQFAPLRIVQILNDREMYRIQSACKRYGSLFQTTIAPSLIAALHYTTLIRGLRPAELWPFENEPLWPKFIAVLAGLVSRYFVTGLRNGALQHSAANESERDRRRRANYANEYKAKSNCLTTRDIHERADSEEIRHPEKYLDLVHKRKTCWNGGGGGGGASGGTSIVRPIWNLYHDDDSENRLHLLTRKIFVPRLCYSCDDYCLMSKIRFRDHAMLEYDDDDDHDEEERRVAAAAAAALAPPPLQPVQGDIVSSTTNSGLERQRREHCVLSNIVKNNDDQYAPEDKVALTNGDFCNLLTLSAPSIHHDALLAYQAFGLRKFPCQYDLGVHLDISRYLFATHATRFVGAAAKQRHCSYSR